MPFEDKTIVCADCGQEFVHSADDQARYAERGFTNEPRRCRACRDKRKTEGGRGGGGGGGGERGGGRSSSGGPRGGGRGMQQSRESFEVVCSECGTTTTVPFKPSGDRPVYCRDCFQKRRGGSRSGRGR
ncbi:MAG: zinc-ribbon domain containing protein [Phycisphaerae bacterium]|jgi:CxxC-x17-CxxC domain-containing protein|nr:zinc-ribbon domain containing protein [Phycisphaerae bacterium]HOO16494.1 zinc-ribbon domain containing protein [Phycisphaerae bacterium]HPC21614.1 zinc-ribbon domain containing protein [Phycisphaerae bacterium]HRS27766.1 zinc-ribbon domain containing protein [Phycisphaerae bacterium]HRT42213.1 zinc-ribbon domain containing protein [Phycisphaerae bacterium]